MLVWDVSKLQKKDILFSCMVDSKPWLAGHRPLFGIVWKSSIGFGAVFLRNIWDTSMEKSSLHRQIKYMKIDLTVMNPPYREPKPEGKTRSGAMLDRKIWDYCLSYDVHIVAVMSAKCNQLKKEKYTYVSEEFLFPTAFILAAIYCYEKNKPLVEIISKYEKNGKYQWLKENRLEHSLADLLEYKDCCIVPANYFCFSNICFNRIVSFMPGDSIVRKNGHKRVCLSYIDCKNNDNVLKMKKYFDEYVNPRFVEFLNRFSDHHVCKGRFCQDYPDTRFHE